MAGSRIHWPFGEGKSGARLFAGPCESVTRGDRRGRERGLESSTPPLAGPRESDGAGGRFPVRKKESPFARTSPFADTAVSFCSHHDSTISIWDYGTTGSLAKLEGGEASVNTVGHDLQLLVGAGF